MKEQDFISKYGNEPQKVTRNFTTKAIATNYHIKDAFIEFGDNAYDARIPGANIDFNISYNDSEHTLIFSDNGTGISNESNLFKLGGTNKENKTAIGKFGIGVPGATAAIATQCIYDTNELVEVIFESACDGRYFVKHIAYTSDGELILGKAEYMDCDRNSHYTKIRFNNVLLKNYPEIIDAIESTFEEPLLRNMNISFNNRQLGKAMVKTFVGDEPVTTVMVGDFPVGVKYRIIGGGDKSARSFEETGLRIYDADSGRLLAKSTNYWRWFADKEAQQNICGLRTGIYIPSTIESYNKFQITPAKNGVTYKLFHKTPDFAELSSVLGAIYTQASKTPLSSGDGSIVIGGKTFQCTSGKMNDLYTEVNDSLIIFKKKYHPSEIAQMINRIITLEKKIERKEKKTKN